MFCPLTVLSGGIQYAGSAHNRRLYCLWRIGLLEPMPEVTSRLAGTPLAISRSTAKARAEERSTSGHLRRAPARNGQA